MTSIKQDAIPGCKPNLTEEGEAYEPIFFHSNTRLAIPQVIFCLQQSDSGSTGGKLGLKHALLLKEMGDL